MRCSICDHCTTTEPSAYNAGLTSKAKPWNPVKYDDKFEEYTCDLCRDLIYGTIKDDRKKYNWDDNLYGLSQNIDHVVAELYQRIPGLSVSSLDKPKEPCHH